MDEEIKINPEEAQTEDIKQEEVKVEDTAKAEAKEELNIPFETKPKKEKAAKVKKADLDKAVKEKEEYLAALVRERADFENYKKRNATAVSKAYADGKADTLAAMLPVLDNFERASATVCADEAYKNGMELIFKQLAEAVSKLGAEEIDCLGKPFDPNVANAVMQVPCEEGEESGTVKTVLMKGYKIGDKVLRHAMVQVTE